MADIDLVPSLLFCFFGQRWNVEEGIIAGWFFVNNLMSHRWDDLEILTLPFIPYIFNSWECFMLGTCTKFCILLEVSNYLYYM